jgi:NAD(P)-dependent dehydrogenase (short-subunit alcohol dehydrogenase family)
VHAAERRRPDLGAAVTSHELAVVDRAAVDALAGALTARGPAHAAVIAAGTNLPERSLGRLTPDAWDTMLAVNLTGAYNVVHALLGALREARGDVVLVGSVSGSWPDPSGPAYQAAKAGLLAFARAAGVEEHAKGVRFTTLLPGVVDTPILDPSRRQPRSGRRCSSPRTWPRPACSQSACLPAHTYPSSRSCPRRCRRWARQTWPPQNRCGLRWRPDDWQST